MLVLINAVKEESNLNLITENFILKLQRFQNISYIELQIVYAVFFCNMLNYPQTDQLYFERQVISKTETKRPELIPSSFLLLCEHYLNK